MTPVQPCQACMHGRHERGATVEVRDSVAVREMDDGRKIQLCEFHNRIWNGIRWAELCEMFLAEVTYWDGTKERAFVDRHIEGAEEIH